MLPGDSATGKPAGRDEFLQLCVQLALYSFGDTLTEDESKCECSLRHSKYQGSLIFYKKDAQISMVQTNIRKKEEIWYLLEPWTVVCNKRPSKRKRGQ